MHKEDKPKGASLSDLREQDLVEWRQEPVSQLLLKWLKEQEMDRLVTARELAIRSDRKVNVVAGMSDAYAHVASVCFERRSPPAAPAQDDTWSDPAKRKSTIVTVDRD